MKKNEDSQGQGTPIPYSRILILSSPVVRVWTESLLDAICTNHLSKLLHRLKLQALGKEPCLEWAWLWGKLTKFFASGCSGGNSGGPSGWFLVGRRGLSPTRKQTSPQQIKPSLCQYLQHSCVTGFPEQSGPVSHKRRLLLIADREGVHYFPSTGDGIHFLLTSW